MKRRFVAIMLCLAISSSIITGCTKDGKADGESAIDIGEEAAKRALEKIENGNGWFKDAFEIDDAPY